MSYNRLLSWADVAPCRKVVETEKWIDNGFNHERFWKRDVSMVKWVTILEEFKSIGKNNLKVIDLGSANGTVPHIIASWGNNVTGIDLNSIDHWCPKGLTKMILGDALHELRQMEDSSVDVITDSCSIHCFEPKWGWGVKNWGWKNTAYEIYRVLKPGGKFISSTDVTVSENPGEFISAESIIEIVESTGLKLTSDYDKNYESPECRPIFQDLVGLHIATLTFEKPVEKKTKKQIKIISHRGNLDGPNPEKENSPKYIDAAINAGFDVEVDLRYINGRIYLGHDKEPYGSRYEVTMGWLYQRKDELWIHCKNREAIDLLSSSVVNFHYFWHDRDEYTMTSKGIALVLVGQIPFKKSIIVLPEAISYYNKYEEKYDRILDTMGVITDQANFYRKELTNYE